MPAIAAFAGDPGTHQDWDFVRQLVQDLGHDREAEARERLAYVLGQWRTIIRTFRHVEDQRMLLQTPTQEDFFLHKACVTGLISAGAMLQLLADDHHHEDLACHGIDKETIEALMRDLHNSLNEWHTQIPDAHLDNLRARIFHGPSADSLEDSRA